MKKRVMSAAVLVAIVVILFVLPANIAKYAIAAALGIVAALAYKEIIDLRVSHKELPNLMVVLGLACTELLVFNTINASYIYNGVSYAMIGLTILLLAIPSIFYKKDKYTTKDAFYLIGATVLIGLFFNLLMLLFNGNKKVKVTLTDINMPARSYTTYIERRIVIGRSAANTDICIDYDQSVSGKHCAIEMRNDKFYLIDLQSSNKTYLNESQVLSEVEISSGSVIKMGRVRMRVEMS